MDGDAMIWVGAVLGAVGFFGPLWRALRPPVVARDDLPEHHRLYGLVALARALGFYVVAMLLIGLLGATLGMFVGGLVGAVLGLPLGWVLLLLIAAVAGGLGWRRRRAKQAHVAEMGRRIGEAYATGLAVFDGDEEELARSFQEEEA